MGGSLLPDGVTARVIERLGVATPPALDLAGLATLYGAWCRAVPFDNIRKLAFVRRHETGPLPGDDPVDFFEQWLRHGAGGTCWAGNGALCELLLALGFDARRGIATMMSVPNAAPNHGTVIVDVPEGRFIADASIMSVEPIPVIERAAARVDHPVWGVTGEWLDQRFAVRWLPLRVGDRIHCRVEEWAGDRARFQQQHEDTRPWSPFNFALTFNLVRGNTRIGIANGLAITINADGTRTTEPIPDRDARTRLLVDKFDVSEELAATLPDDIEMPPPPSDSPAARRVP